MYTQPKLGTIIKDGLNIFAKEWRLLLGANAALMILLLLFSVLEGVDTLFVIPLLLLVIILIPVLSIVNTVIASRRLKGKTTTINDIWNVTYKRFFPVLFTAIVVTLVVFVSFIVLVIPAMIVWLAYQAFLPNIATTPEAAFAFFILAGVFMGIIAIIIAAIVITYLIFSIYISILEKRSCFQAIRKSYQMVRGNWWKTFGKIVVIQLIIVGISFTVQLIFLPATLTVTDYTAKRAVNGVATLIQQLAVLPFSLAFVALYVGSKKAKEVSEKTTKKKAKKTTEKTRRKTTKKKTTNKKGKKKT